MRQVFFFVFVRGILKRLLQPQGALGESRPSLPKELYAVAPIAKRSSRRRRWVITGLLVGLVVVIAAAITVPLVLTRKNSSNDNNGGSSSNDGNSATSGTSGSLITMDDGTRFTYQNDFGGDWVYDPKKPFESGGKSQSWSKRIGSGEWVWGQDIARGVNLG